MPGMPGQLLKPEGRSAFADINAAERAASVQAAAALTVGERLERGLELSRLACEVRDAFAPQTGQGEPRP